MLNLAKLKKELKKEYQQQSERMKVIPLR